MVLGKVNFPAFLEPEILFTAVCLWVYISLGLHAMYTSENNIFKAT